MGLVFLFKQTDSKCKQWEETRASVGNNPSLTGTLPPTTPTQELFSVSRAVNYLLSSNHSVIQAHS